MGELADDVFTGFRCRQCGCIVDGEEPDHPRDCADCEEDDRDDFEATFDRDNGDW